jgi:cytochrome c oxidase assembly protein subunit 15
VHFAHRVGALIVVLSVIATSAHIWYHHPKRSELTRPASLLLLLVASQVTLGALTVLSQRDVWINSVHLVNGALVLATSIVITLRSWQSRFGEGVRLEVQTTTANDVRSARLQPDHGFRP